MTAESSSKILRVLQFTDTHFFQDSSHKLLGVDTAASFAEVYKKAKASHGTPDFYLLTGDISQDESEKSYRRFSEAMSDAGAEAYFIPGNHDRREEMCRGLSGSNPFFSSERRIIRGHWQIILLDSLIDGAVGGHLEESELEFLEESLRSRTEGFTLICLHHHPLEIGARWLDRIGVDNGAEFMQIVENYESVKGILWGHVHQQFEGKHKGIALMATPSTCVQFKRSNDFGVDAQPPGYRYLELHADGSIHTEVVRTDNVAVGLELSSAGY